LIIFITRPGWMKTARERFPKVSRRTRRDHVDPRSTDTCVPVDRSVRSFGSGSASGLARSWTRTGAGAGWFWEKSAKDLTGSHLFQKRCRTGFGSNNVDHCTRLCHARRSNRSWRGLTLWCRHPRRSQPRSMAEVIIPSSGANPTVNHPVVGYVH